MLIHTAHIKISGVLVFTATFFTICVSGQSPTASPMYPDKTAVAARVTKPNDTEKDNKPAPRATPGSASDLEEQIAAVKAENAAVREQLRKMDEQQKTLLELVQKLEHNLDSSVSASGSTTASAGAAGTSSVPTDPKGAALP